MKTKMPVANWVLEALASAIVITLYIADMISGIYALVGLVIALSLSWPFKAKRKSNSL